MHKMPDTSKAPDIAPRALLSECMAARDWQIGPTPVVVLPDNTVGEVVWASPEGDEVHVIHGDRVMGRGPWIMHPSQCERADMAQTISYMRRVGK